VTCGIANTFVIKSRDQKDNEIKSGGNIFQIKIEKALTFLKIENTVTDCQNGTYFVEFTPPSNGTYIISVLYSNIHVTGSPMTIDCTGEKKS